MNNSFSAYWSIKTDTQHTCAETTPSQGCTRSPLLGQYGLCKFTVHRAPIETIKSYLLSPFDVPTTDGSVTQCMRQLPLVGAWSTPPEQGQPHMASRKWMIYFILVGGRVE